VSERNPSLSQADRQHRFLPVLNPEPESLPALRPQRSEIQDWPCYPAHRRPPDFVPHCPDESGDDLDQRSPLYHTFSVGPRTLIASEVCSSLSMLQPYRTRGTSKHAFAAGLSHAQSRVRRAAKAWHTADRTDHSRTVCQVGNRSRDCLGGHCVLGSTRLLPLPLRPIGPQRLAPRPPAAAEVLSAARGGAGRSCTRAPRRGRVVGSWGIASVGADGRQGKIAAANSCQNRSRIGEVCIESVSCLGISSAHGGAMVSAGVVGVRSGRRTIVARPSHRPHVAASFSTSCRPCRPVPPPRPDRPQVRMGRSGPRAQRSGRRTAGHFAQSVDAHPAGRRFRFPAVAGSSQAEDVIFLKCESSIEIAADQGQGRGHPSGLPAKAAAARTRSRATEVVRVRSSPPHHVAAWLASARRASGRLGSYSASARVHAGTLAVQGASSIPPQLSVAPAIRSASPPCLSFPTARPCVE